MVNILYGKQSVRAMAKVIGLMKSHGLMMMLGKINLIFCNGEI